MVDSSEVLKTADSGYKPFAAFEGWRHCVVNESRWSEALAILKGYIEKSDEPLRRRALVVVQRAAAIETGAIEDLYPVDQGVTLTFATEGAILEAAYGEKTASARRLIESQLNAYDYVMDFATRSAPLGEKWIRELHAVMCASQEAYTVHLLDGKAVEKELPKGEYKSSPNHVIQKDGSLHSYTPVHLTKPEMDRLITEVRSSEFEGAHPALQAAYLHHGITAIHPFQDGNGRVARALASVYLYRAASLPLLIFAEHKSVYFEALRRADSDDPQSFVDFMFERAVESVQYAVDSLKTASLGAAESELSQFKGLYRTRGGYTHPEVDAAGQSMLNTMLRYVREQAEKLGISEIRFKFGENTFDLEPMPRDYRRPVTQPRNGVDIVASSVDPAGAEVTMRVGFFVPRNADVTDGVVLATRQVSDGVVVPMNQILPRMTMGATLRVRMYADRVFGETLRMLRAKAEQRFRDLGY